MTTDHSQGSCSQLLRCLGQHSVGIDTAFATISDTPTHNLGVLVQATVGVQCALWGTGFSIICRGNAGSVHHMCTGYTRCKWYTESLLDTLGGIQDSLEMYRIHFKCTVYRIYYGVLDSQ